MPLCTVGLSQMNTSLKNLSKSGPGPWPRGRTVPVDRGSGRDTAGGSSVLGHHWTRVKYEDPLATKGLAGALDARQQNTGVIPVPQASLMEDIEQWLSTDVAEDPKGVTSEEFDKFLEERAKVADRLPTVPNPPTGAPSPPTSSGAHQKKEKEGDAMFAL